MCTDTRCETAPRSCPYQLLVKASHEVAVMGAVLASGAAVGDEFLPAGRTHDLLAGFPVEGVPVPVPPLRTTGFGAELLLLATGRLLHGSPTHAARQKRHRDQTDHL